MFLNVIEKVDDMKRMVLGHLLSAASVYVTMSFLTKVFLDLIHSFSLTVM